TVLRVDDPPRPSRYFSLLRNTAHSNVTHLMKEKAELLPGENTLTVVHGFIGAYPNAIYRATPAQVPDFTRAIRGLASEDDYRALASRFAIRRTSPDFWAASDALIEAYARWAPLEAGLFDYNRLENR
ncbi:MAG TPA: fatty acid cis/trans isomerase, partial [Burkholderiaceae bacterium]|nr:fatty acid cis/trans isomerase [Burkholderiaceae bacterium]